MKYKLLFARAEWNEGSTRQKAENPADEEGKEGRVTVTEENHEQTCGQ